MALLINSLSATEFISINEDIVYDKEIAIKEIIDTVSCVEEKSKKLSIEKVSVREALECLTLFQDFTSQNDLDVDASFV